MKKALIILGIFFILVSLYLKDARFIFLSLAAFTGVIYVNNLDKKQKQKFKVDNKTLRYKKIFKK